MAKSPKRERFEPPYWEVVVRIKFLKNLDDPQVPSDVPHLSSEVEKLLRNGLAGSPTIQIIDTHLEEEEYEEEED